MSQSLRNNITFDSAIESWFRTTQVTLSSLQKPSGRCDREVAQRCLMASIWLVKEKLETEAGRKVMILKVMILISDGDDNLSLETLTGTLDLAQKSNVSIDTISTNASGFLGITAPKADKVLKCFAEDTGDRAFFLFKAEDLSESLQDTSTELHSQYSVA